MSIEYHFSGNAAESLELYMAQADGPEYLLGIDADGLLQTSISGTGPITPIPYVRSSGDTMTGNLIVPTLSGSSIFDGGNRVVTDVNSQAGPTINLTTSDISEGSNLYYTEGRVTANPTVSGNTADIVRNVTDIVTVSGLTVTNANDIAQNVTDIATVSGIATQNTTDIMTVSGVAVQNESDIANVSGTAFTAVQNGSNVGDGFDIFSAKNGTALEFNTVSGVGNVSITAEGNTVVFSGTGDGNGDVVGPASATDNAIAVYDGATGKLIKNSSASISDITDNASDIATVSGIAIQNTANIVTVSGLTVANANDIAQNVTDIATVSGIATQNATDIATVSGISIQNSVDIVTVSGLTVTNASDISQNITDIATVSGIAVQNTADILTVSGITTQNTTDIATVSGIAIQNTADIVTVSGLTVTNASNISQNTADIATVSGIAIQNQTDIATVSGITVQNTSDISQNTTDIANVSGVAFSAIQSGTSLGAGEDIFVQKNGTNLEFRSLVAGSGIALVSGTNTITINNEASTSTSYGELWMSGNSIATPFDATSTPVIISGSTTQGEVSNFTQSNSDNSLTYTGADAQVFLVILSTSMSGAANDDVAISISKNGTRVGKTTIIRKVSTGGDVGSATAQGLISLSTNDKVQPSIENGSDTTSATVDNMNFALHSIEHGGGSGGGGGGSGEIVEFDVNQTTHGFAVRDAIYHNGTQFVKAQANAETTLGLWIVSAVSDANNFTAAQAGKFTDSGHGLTAGEYYFVSPTVAGGLTATLPSGASEFVNPLVFVEDGNTLHVLPFRPSAVSPGGGNGGEDNTASNVGDGLGVFKQKTGVDLEFYTVSGLGNVDVSLNGNVVEVSGVAGGGSGDVVGPASAVNNGIPSYNGTTGKLIDSPTGITVNSSGTLNSAKYTLGSGPDLSLIPIVGGQSVITTWWGMQLIGNKQSTVDYQPVDIGNNSDFSVIIPNQQASKVGLIVEGAASQTGDLQVWRDSSQAELASVDLSGNIASIGHLEVGEIQTPSTPSAGFGRFYAKSDGNPYFLNDGGTETDLSTGSFVAPQRVQTIQTTNLGQDINQTTNVTLLWDTNQFIDTGLFTHTVGTSGITVLSTGNYKITYNVNFDNNNASRDSPRCSIYVNGVENVITRATSYTRTTSNNFGTITLPPFEIALTANDVIAMNSVAVGNVSAVSTVDGTWLRIEEA